MTIDIKGKLYRQRVLIVDDRPDNLAVLQETLKYAYRAKVTAVDNAPDALIWLLDPDHPAPTVIVSDIQMPGMDGFAFLRRIRALPQFMKVPVLALTANAMAGDREKVLEAGFDGYISKPMTVASFEAGMQEMYENWREPEPAPTAPSTPDAQSAAPGEADPPVPSTAGPNLVVTAHPILPPGMESNLPLSLTCSEENTNG